MRRRTRGVGALVATLVAACAGTPSESLRANSATEAVDSAPALGARDATYILTWGDARIGSAREQLRRTRGGWELVRDERISIARGGAAVHLHTTVRIELDGALRAQRLRVLRRSDHGLVEGEATRARDGAWRVRFAGEPARRLPGDALPLELVPLALARAPERRLQGTVLLAGYGFATAELYAKPSARGDSVLATFVVASGVLTNELVFDDAGELVRIVSPGNVEAYRASADEAAQPFAPPELVDAASIPVTGRSAPGEIVRLELTGVASPTPPPLPGQLVRADGDRWSVTLAPGFAPASPELPAERAATPVDAQLAAVADDIVVRAHAATPLDEVRALAAATDRLLGDDLGAPALDARSALALGRGDCTAHAALFATFAAARGLDVRLVTGYRLDGARLIRHRWAIVWLGDRWIAVDPTHGEAPAAPVLLGLAVHGDTAAEIAVVDDAAFAGFRTARARFSSP